MLFWIRTLKILQIFDIKNFLGCNFLDTGSFINYDQNLKKDDCRYSINTFFEECVIGNKMQKFWFI